jgi:hypothetical protein
MWRHYGPEPPSGTQNTIGISFSNGYVIEIDWGMDIGLSAER